MAVSRRLRFTKGFLRSLAARYGLDGPGVVEIPCAYCAETTTLHWLTDDERDEWMGRMSLHSDSIYRPVFHPTWEIQTRFQVDHIVPISKGGPHTIENVTYACPSCNARKRDLDLDEWNERRAVVR